MGVFFQLRFLFPNHSNLYQAVNEIIIVIIIKTTKILIKIILVVKISTVSILR